MLGCGGKPPGLPLVVARFRRCDAPEPPATKLCAREHKIAVAMRERLELDARLEDLSSGAANCRVGGSSR